MTWLMSGKLYQVHSNFPVEQAWYPQIAMIPAIIPIVAWITVVRERGISEVVATC
jgi:hypothetical protein